eukprot:9334596-Pyramimonas_sp.AAC.1
MECEAHEKEELRGTKLNLEATQGVMASTEAEVRAWLEQMETVKRDIEKRLAKKRQGAEGQA